MNRKQIISMWCGIVAVGWVSFIRTPMFIGHYYGSSSAYHSVDWSGFFLWTILISLITGGLIYTFRDKKPGND